MIFLGDATEYSKHLFRVLDTDNDTMVSWKEVMLGFHHLSPNGDPDQKLKIVYSVSITVVVFPPFSIPAGSGKLYLNSRGNVGKMGGNFVP